MWIPPFWTSSDMLWVLMPLSIFEGEGSTWFGTVFIRGVTSWCYPVGLDSMTLSYENFTIPLLGDTWVQPKP